MQDENEKIDSPQDENTQEEQEISAQDSKESLENKIKELEDRYFL